ncbi:MAG TPA: carboxypeptidase regulatory-like domain-containing protein [Candidatus Andersenbacteria bacterium]|nr:carboxypeptidase regulatory-like domain-containing protein [Candidatus Andersenbacteria bacterium]
MQPQRGFTLVEILIVTFIVATTVVGIFGLFILSLRTAQEAERRVVAVALANERMEMIRNLPYQEVGTAGGVPSGPIAQSEVITRNNLPYTVRVDIRYVDNAYDGQVGGGTEGEEKIIICHRPGTPSEQTLEVSASALDAHLAHGDTTGPCGGAGEGTPSGDEYNADYKQVRVEVSWPSPNAAKPVLLITYVAPPGIEGGEDGGTLDFQALDAGGEAVAGATVQLVNAETDPPVNLTTQTNIEGRLVLPGLPVATDSYELAVSKGGYTTEQTYAIAPNFIPDTDHAHLSMLLQEVTSKTFFIDLVSSLTLSFVEGGSGADDNQCDDNPGQGQGQGNQALRDIAYHLQGTKTIGTDGSGESVYRVAVDGISDNQGEAEHENLIWDQYELTLDAAVACDIKETSLPLPVVLDPGESVEVDVSLVAHTPVSLHVTVLTAGGAPVDNATVELTGPGVAEEDGTGPPGQVFFADLPVDGDYTLTVNAPGFMENIQIVAVAGTTRTVVSLTPTP